MNKVDRAFSSALAEIASVCSPCLPRLSVALSFLGLLAICIMNG